MNRGDYLARKLEAIEVAPKSISGLLEAMGRTGFQGKSLARAFQVLRRMLTDPDTVIFLGYSGSLSTTGQWKIIRWLIENRFVDVLVSTGANVTEDVVEELGISYYQGSHMVDDAELLRHQIDRYYDVYVDELEYRKMESFLGEFLGSLAEPGPYSSADLLNRFGRYQTERGMNSITAAAYRAGVPVFSPALADSGLGVATYLLHKRGGLRIAIDQLRDFVQLGQIGERASSTSVIYVGGGVPKDTVQLVTVMASLAAGGEEAKPHKYAVQITTDSPQWGGLSGCTFEEAISWGKIADEEEDRAVCYCDATIALPILSHALTEVLPGRRNGPDLSWIFS